MKKQLTVNQLQFRLFILIFFIFILTKISYRIFIERPNIEQALAIIIEQDIADISLAANNQLVNLATSNYDYALSNTSYRFMQKPELFDENEYLINDSFRNLDIEGAFFIDKAFSIVFEKTLDLSTGDKIPFEFLNFNRYPKNKILLINNILADKNQANKGIIQTIKGPAFFSVMPIKRLNSTKDHQGYLLFVRLIKKSFLNHLAVSTRTEINMTSLDKGQSYDHLADWRDNKAFFRITPTNERLVKDFHGQAIALLTIVHTSTTMEAWFGFRGIIYVSVFFLLLFIIHRYFINIFVKPVEKLASELKSMKTEQSLNVLNETTNIVELNGFSRDFNQLTLMAKKQKKLLSAQAFLDPLTNIANRRAFELHLNEQLNLLTRHNIRFCLIMADIDHFKRFNDSLGHQAGDKALIEVAQLLNHFFKRSHDICARYGGEEFIMIFSDVTANFVDEKANEILQALQKIAIEHPDSPTSSLLTLSLGLCLVEPSQGKKQFKGDDIIKLADKALYQAKDNGRNQFCIEKFLLK
ncbi:MAG: diguanylate cyclase [Colwellia sp.]|nr:diguanylate cyclase [Colwellia sp.]